MSDNIEKAVDSAERAGGYLQAAERFVDDPGLSGTANAYAQMATASATLSVAQRLAAIEDALAEQMA